MGQILRNRYIFAALGFSALLVAGAYLLARGTLAPAPAEASTETALLQQIATQDSTGDGLPDWEKALYGIPADATTTDYFHLGMTDGAAVAKGLLVPVASGPSAHAAASSTAAAATVGGVAPPAPGSLTDSFARNFFALYVSAEQGAGGALTSDQINTLAEQALQELAASATPVPDFKTAADIKIAGSGPDALRAYGNDARAIVAKYDPRLPEDQLQYLSDYLSGNDATALANVSAIAQFYQNIATGFAALAVPQEASSAHLALVNDFARIGWETADFGRVQSDPLAAMLALEQYPNTVAQMNQDLHDLTGSFAAEGVALPKEP